VGSDIGSKTFSVNQAKPFDQSAIVQEIFWPGKIDATVKPKNR